MNGSQQGPRTPKGTLTQHALGFQDGVLSLTRKAQNTQPALFCDKAAIHIQLTVSGKDDVVPSNKHSRQARAPDESRE
jgi:hypothetical protein